MLAAQQTPRTAAPARPLPVLLHRRFPSDSCSLVTEPRALKAPQRTLCLPTASPRGRPSPLASPPPRHPLGRVASSPGPSLGRRSPCPEGTPRLERGGGGGGGGGGRENVKRPLARSLPGSAAATGWRRRRRSRGEESPASAEGESRPPARDSQRRERGMRGRGLAALSDRQRPPVHPRRGRPAPTLGTAGTLRGRGRGGERRPPGLGGPQALAPGRGVRVRARGTPPGAGRGYPGIHSWEVAPRECLSSAALPHPRAAPRVVALSRGRRIRLFDVHYSISEGIVIAFTVFSVLTAKKMLGVFWKNT